MLNLVANSCQHKYIFMEWVWKKEEKHCIKKDEFMRKVFLFGVPFLEYLVDAF